MKIANPPLWKVTPLSQQPPSKSWGPVKPTFLKIWLEAQPPPPPPPPPPTLPLQKGGCPLWKPLWGGSLLFTTNSMAMAINLWSTVHLYIMDKDCSNPLLLLHLYHRQQLMWKPHKIQLIFLKNLWKFIL